MRVLLILMLSGFAFGNDLLDKLHAELSEKGETSFSDTQIVLIADGISDETALNEAVEKWENFIYRIKLSEKDAMQNGKKKMRMVNKRAKPFLKKGVTKGATLMDLVKSGKYTRISATWFYVSLADGGGLVAKDYKNLLKFLDPYFFKDREPKLRDIAAGYLMFQANQWPDERKDDLIKALNASHMLADLNYGEEFLGKPLYNRVKTKYDAAIALDEEGKKEEASELLLETAVLAVAVTDCFSKMKVFDAVCFNIGTKLIQLPAAQKYPEKVTKLLLGLTEHTGEHRKSFEANLQIHLYNHAARLYNEKKYTEAAATFEKITDPPSPQDYKAVLASCYTLLIDQAFADKDLDNVRDLMTKLTKVDPSKAKVMDQRLKQLELIELVKSGGMDKALVLAAKDLTNDINRGNYVAVLTQFNQAKRELGEFEGGLKVLDEAVIEEWSKESIEALRLNTYVDWEKTYKEEDYQNLIVFYAKVFADDKLVLTDKNKEVFRHNYGSALHASITKLIETRKWKEASEANTKALKLVPGHQDLLTQRGLIDRILKRVGGN